MFFGTDLIKSPADVFASGINWGLFLPLFLLVGSGAMQFLSAKKMMPAAKTDISVAKKTKDKEDDMAVAMRNQSIYMMPLMTLVIGWKFSLGILLYWFMNSAMMLVQQMWVKRGK